MKKKIAMVLITIFMFYTFLDYFSEDANAQVSYENLTQILFNNLDCKDIEYSLKAEFECNSKTKNIFSDIKSIAPDISIFAQDSEENSKCMELKSMQLNGYIDTYHNGNDNYIVVNITEKSSYLMLNDILIRLKKMNKNINIYKNAKAEICLDKDLKTINNKEQQILKNCGITDMNTIRINKGYSSTAFIKSDNYIINNGHKIDLNISVCNYSSKNCIIIGTPDIFVSY